MTEFDSAMYNDPRYKRHTDAMKGDSRMENPKKARSAMYKDPRYERHFDTMKDDPRFHNSDPTTTWSIFTKRAHESAKANEYKPGTWAAENRTKKMQKAYNEYQTAKKNYKKKKRWS